MKFEYVKEQLMNKGYELKVVKINKNGVIKNGIVVNGIVIYPEDYSGMSAVIYMIESAKMPYDTSRITSVNFILGHAFIGFAKEVAANIVQRETEFNGIVQYIYVRVDDKGTYKLPIELYKEDLDVLWETARRNTFAHTLVFPIADLFGSGLDTTFVVTNDLTCRGASAILDMDTIRSCVPQGKYVAMPSSTEEFILYKTDDDTTPELEYFSNMVKEINSEVVEAEIQLPNKAYLIEV